jgi:hypothetical protein
MIEGKRIKGKEYLGCVSYWIDWYRLANGERMGNQKSCNLTHTWLLSSDYFLCFGLKVGTCLYVFWFLLGNFLKAL